MDENVQKRIITFKNGRKRLNRQKRLENAGKRTKTVKKRTRTDEMGRKGSITVDNDQKRMQRFEIDQNGQNRSKTVLKSCVSMSAQSSSSSKFSPSPPSKADKGKGKVDDISEEDKLKQLMPFMNEGGVQEPEAWIFFYNSNFNIRLSISTIRPHRTGKSDRTGPNVFRSGPRSGILDQFGLRSGPVLPKTRRLCRVGPDRTGLDRPGPDRTISVRSSVWRFEPNRSRCGPVLAGPVRFSTDAHPCFNMRFRREEEFHLSTTAQPMRTQSAIHRGMFKKMELTIEARNDVTEARKIVKENLDGICIN
nr:hypothetical protein [Tanacetum cinerariifolium]